MTGITARANAAALVGESIAQLDKAQHQIKELEAQLASSITAATTVMNLGELAAFVDSSVPKLTAAGKPRTRVRGPRKPRVTADAVEDSHRSQT